MPRLERSYADLARPLGAFTFTVNLPEHGARLDVLLRAHFPWRSRTRFQRMLERGEVTVDGRPAKGSQRVREGQSVAVSLPRDPAAPELEDGSDLVVLYEDERLLAIDKPSGMTVHPVGRIRHGTLINKLHARYPRTGRRDDVVPRLGHRLDKDTSGVVLVVKDRVVDAAVTELFTQRRVSKTYLAIVEGAPRGESGEVDAPLAQDPDGDTLLHMRVDPQGQVARTRWRVRERFRRHALLELSPLTGRTHQLRVHMAHLGHPILCDHLYGSLRPLWRCDLAPRAGGEDLLLDRLALHAHRLQLEHPVSGAPLALESPLPGDLVRALEALRTLAAAGPQATEAACR
ncbi:MAG: RluA family pseudouridine synthase [Planctomycetia bacterium]